MNYTVRPAGPRSKREQMHYYMVLAGFIIKIALGILLSFAAAVALLTANYGVLAIVFISVVLFGVSFNFLKLRQWLPGWRNGTWFSRTVSLVLYLFVGLMLLLVVNPSP